MSELNLTLTEEENPLQTPRRKSYNGAFKLRAVEYADEISPATGQKRGTKKAAEEFQVTERMICKWRNEKQILQATPKI